MFDGKFKAITFSYDDAVTQDIRFIELLDRYGLKTTFNINSELLGLTGSLIRGGVEVDHTKVPAEQVASIYQNHEVAVHTLTHPNLKNIAEDAEVIRQVEQDRLNLEALVRYPVRGMAYPCGGDCYDARTIRLLKQHTGVAYARTTSSNASFDRQAELLDFSPTVHHTEFSRMFELGEAFVNAKPDRPQIFYIWGHTYEFDIADTWDQMEEFMKLISRREDIFYGTNQEVLLGLPAHFRK